MSENISPNISSLSGQVLATCGFLSLSVAVLLAHLSPTRGYELSLYAGTPLSVWVLLFASFCIGVVLAFFAQSAVRRLGPVLATFVVIVVSGLPVIRGYVLFGQFDLLNHAGTVTEVLNLGGFESSILYPAMHTEAATLSLIAGISGYHALSSLTVVFVGLFVIGGTMLVRGFDSSWWTEATGVFMLCLLLPIISIRLPKLQAIPAAFAMFYWIFLLGLLTRLFQSRSSTVRRVTYILVGPALVFYHPQFALIAFGTGILLIVCLQLFGRWLPYESYLVRRAFGFSILVGVILWEWISKLPGFRGALQKVVVGASSGGSGIPDPSGKLQAVGGSTTEIVLKVFGIRIAVSLIGLGVGLLLLKQSWKVKQRYSTSLYLVAGAGLMTLPLIGLFFSFLGRVSQGFRYIGFAFGLASVVAAVGIGVFLNRSGNKKWARIGVALFLIMGALVVTPTLFKSPYVFQANEQVSQGQLTGYDFVFEHRDEGQITAIDTSPYRARNALYGKSQSQSGIGRPPNTEVVYQYGESFTPATTEVPSHFSNQTFHQNSTNVYVIATARGRTKYLQMYGGYRYNRADFVYLERNSGTVYTNGDLKAHYFD